MTESTPFLERLRIMWSHSGAVFRERDVAVFDRLEKEGTVRDALTYVAVAAAVSGLFALGVGPGAFLGNVVGTVAGFFVFVYLVYFVGSRRGGTGTLSEVAYSFALFWAPLNVAFTLATFVLVISVVGLTVVPLLAIVVLGANVWFAYLATRASLNVTSAAVTITTLILAGVLSLAVNLVLAAVLA
ncbi:MAG: hypothetical protein RI554_09870 [Trueperaceae bacterium]|nr:hypothetical protein [Trueperaceae bacterium]